MGKRVLVARRNKPVLILGGIFFAIGVSLVSVDLYLGIARYKENRRFEQDGQTVTGKVLAKRVRTTRTTGGGSGASFSARVAFQSWRGEEIVQSVEMTPWGLGRLKEQGPIQVTYVRDDPRLFRVDGQLSEAWLIIVILTIVGGCFSLLGGLVVTSLIREHRQSRRRTELRPE